MTRRWAALALVLAVGACSSRSSAGCLHATWDGVGTIPVYIVLAVISLGLLTWFAHLVARETRVHVAVAA